MVNNNDDLSQSITELSERIEYLQARCVSDPANSAEVLSDALDNLQISLEELSAADEELMQQNEELIVAKEALKESEEKYRTIVETANEGIWVTDAETRTTYVNKRMADMLGYSPEEMIGKSFNDFMDEEGRAFARLKLERRRQGIKESHEHKFVRKDGSPLWVISNVTPLNDKDGKFAGSLGMLTDITERKKAEEMRSLLASIVDSTDEAIIGKTLDGTIISWNAGAEKIYGYSANEAIGKPISILIPPNHPDEMPQILENIRRGEKVDHYETLRLRKDGHTIYVSLIVSPIRNESGEIVGASTIAADITERRKAEEMRSFLASIVDSAEEAIIGKTLDGIIVSWNAGAEKIYGYSADEVIDRPISLLIPPDHIDEMPQILERISLGEKVDRYETMRLRKDGRQIYVSLTVSPIINEHGAVVGASTIAADITERKRAEVALQEAHEELEVAAEELRLQNDELLCTQSALQESEARLRRLYESGLIGVIYWNMDGVIKDANDKFLEMVGYTRQDLVAGRIDWVNMTPPEYRHLDESSTIELKATGVNKKPFEKEYIRKDGTRIPIIVAGAMLDEARFNGVAFVLDITDRKRAEEELRESEEKLSALYASMVEGVSLHEIVYDNEGNPLDYIITDVNPSYEKITGLSRDKASGQRASALYGTNEPPYLDIYAKVASSGAPESFETYFEPMKKHFSISVFSPAQGKFATVFSDITERKQADDALRETKDYLENLIDYANAPIIVWDAFFKITRFNHAFERLTGLKADEVLDKPLDILFSEESRNKSLEYIRRTLSGERWEVVEIPILRIDGSIRTVLWNSANVYAQDGTTVVATIAQGQDITERKQMEMELWKARDELELKVQERTAELYEAKENLEVINEELQVEISEHEKTEKELMKAKDAAEAAVEAKAAFLANMSHELRTPMNAVIGYSSLLLDDSLTHEQKDYVESIRNGGEALLSIINDILEFSRAEKDKVKLECQPLSLKHCVDESLDMVAVHASQKGLNLAYTVSYGTPDTIISDHGRLRQILANLLSNAVKFTDNGDISVSVSSKAIVGNKRQITFTVKDTGIGMPKDKMDILFKPFTQLEYIISRKRDGAGLGLAICKKLVELMGGEIWAESEEGKGSTFRFTIQAEAVPGKQLNFGETDRDHAYENLSEQKPLAILVAEDNPSNQKVLVEMLKRMGYRPDAVADGCEVLQALKIRPYDLVLMDIRMPEMDGLTATKEIRRLWPDNGPRVVAITAFAMEGDREKCLEAGMDGYIAKPIQNGALAEVLKRYTLETQ